MQLNIIIVNMSYLKSTLLIELPHSCKTPVYAPDIDCRYYRCVSYGN